MGLNEAIRTIEALIEDIEKSERDGSGPVGRDDVDLLALKIIMQSMEDRKAVQHAEEKGED